MNRDEIRAEYAERFPRYAQMLASGTVSTAPKEMLAAFEAGVYCGLKRLGEFTKVVEGQADTYPPASQTNVLILRLKKASVKQKDWVYRIGYYAEPCEGCGEPVEFFEDAQGESVKVDAWKYLGV